MKRLYTLLLMVSCFYNASAQIPDWSNSVAAIIYDNCTGCHRPGEIGPFSLTNYLEASDYAFSIQSAVNAKVMPPWSPDANYVHFTGERILSETQIATINDWVNAGTPEGNPDLAPPLPSFTDGSQLGVPDLVLEMSEVYTTPGNGVDDYHIFVLPSGLTEDKYISAVEFRPGNGAAVHHALIYVDTTGKGQIKDAADPGYGYEGIGIAGSIGFTAPSIGGWAPGNLAVMMPQGIAQKIYANSDILLEMHFAPSASPLSDQSLINIFYSDVPDPRIVKAGSVDELDISNGWLSIPANTVKTFYSDKSINTPISLLTVTPHMHLLGQTMKAFAVTADNDTIEIIDCNYDFHWQNEYMFQKLLPIPAGSKIYMTTVYDNTANNPDNPNNPPQDVSWGIQTTDEMQILFYSYLDYEPGDEYIVLDSSLISTETFVDLQTTKAVNIFPNPAADYFLVNGTTGEAAIVVLRLFNAMGMLIEERSIYVKGHSFMEQFNTSQLPGGFYFLETSTKKGITLYKIVRQ
jgi:hypothetical protein